MIKVEETPKKRLDTVALPVSELQEGMHYHCILADNRKVQYIGNKCIKWYSQPTDEYKIDEVHDYQLKPLNNV